MKRFLIGLVIACSLASCHFTEKVVFNEDGSGEFAFKINMSEMLKQMSGLDKSDSTATKPNEVIDSSFSFAELFEMPKLKDSIAKLSDEQKVVMQRIIDMNMRMGIHSDRDKKEMWMSYLFDFKDINRLSDFYKTINEAQGLGAGKGEKIPTNSEVSYSLKKNEFKRIVTAKKLNKEEKEVYEAYLLQSAMFLSKSKYTVEYHFPKMIKSTTAKGATFSSNKKILYFTKDFEEILATPKVLEFNVVLAK